MEIAMKLRNRSLWAVAPVLAGAFACSITAQAGQHRYPKAPAPVVEMPAEVELTPVSSWTAGPTVPTQGSAGTTAAAPMPREESAALAAPAAESDSAFAAAPAAKAAYEPAYSERKIPAPVVSVAPGTDTAGVRTAYSGPVINMSQDSSISQDH